MIQEIEKEIDDHEIQHGIKKNVELLDTIPGVDKIAASAILAEIGTDMNRFPTAEHLSSWAGLSPGNNESGGKKKVVRPPMETNG